LHHLAVDVREAEVAALEAADEAGVVENDSKRAPPPAGSYQQATDLYLPRSTARIGNDVAVVGKLLGGWGNWTLNTLRVPDPSGLVWILSAAVALL
jgi:hypothetical protein